MNRALEYLRASRASEIASLQRLLRTGEQITAISELVHVLQRERGASNIWLCSAGRLFGAELKQRVAEVEQRERSAMAVLPEAEAQPGYSRFCMLIATALQALDGLTALRQQVHNRSVTQAQAMDAFNHIICTLLNLVFEAADTASEPDISRALIALFSFMQGKELAGQERATGSAGFAAGEFSEAQRQCIQALIDAQEQSFATFSQFADAENLQRWRVIADAGSQIERLRRIACTGAQCGENGVLLWFTLLSTRLDQMKQIENTLCATLMRSCQRAIAAAQQADHPALAPTEDASFSLYVAGASWLSGSETTLDSNGLAPQLGRSVLTLIREQAHRLQVQADELAMMRTSLDERKIIDQAKSWLMQQHHFSEQDAWQALRKSAMNQNKRVLEIAQAVLAVAATLKA
ncbi:nitrate- and nitrite sensing domain-containing protein [Pantoea sp. BIGb0393]|uniref:Nitrate- and nitrite sensing domain-containing protein n=1 Tax=Pantoea nemavictus TaxID=2726955 RepID=A0ABU8PM44_9GAMM|nr:nitrate regulatory protein [Pantoea nemavictus]MBA0034828.1 nitrate- and nitrite sensing domain-containing protein [Pantoea nemavictus]